MAHALADGLACRGPCVECRGPIFLEPAIERDDGRWIHAACFRRVLTNKRVRWITFSFQRPLENPPDDDE
jgi:hypothetical protein